MRLETLIRFLVGGAGAAIAAAAIVLMLTAGAAHGAPATSRTLATFTTTGTYSWTVPTGISTVTFDVFGASGGNAVNGSVLVSKGGAGGEARARFAVKPGQRFEIVVGGSGGAPAFGFNGGGRGSEGGEGGGGSDVRIGGVGNPCASNKSCGYSDRIVVGGGGGGGGQSGDGGGAGGGLSGTPGADGASAGGGQEQGASICQGGMYAGCFGQGGSSPMGQVDGAGGGGGGWYGGNATSSNGGGGGGSGFVSRFALSGSFPGGTQTGAGRVVITTP